MSPRILKSDEMIDYLPDFSSECAISNLVAVLGSDTDLLLDFLACICDVQCWSSHYNFYKIKRPQEFINPPM